MRKLIPAIGAFIASGLIAGAALADGLPESIKDTPVEGPQWSGFYLGAGVGYGHAVLDNNYNETGGTTFAQSLEGEGMRGGLATLIFGLDRRISDRLVVGSDYPFVIRQPAPGAFAASALKDVLFDANAAILLGHAKEEDNDGPG